MEVPLLHQDGLCEIRDHGPRRVHVEGVWCGVVAGREKGGRRSGACELELGRPPPPERHSPEYWMQLLEALWAMEKCTLLASL